ncbi:MAG: ASCH domain-containing protein [Clostridia bacterium]|nr:ASCH domain-containing protein [Clostridia bacterium]
MNLAPSAFKSIGIGKKTIEMRLYDEKRAKLNVGDEIVFENTETHQKIKCNVINLTRYKDFFELYSNFDKVAIGYKINETANAEDMYAYYSPEQVVKYGVLAIEIKLI